MSFLGVFSLCYTAFHIVLVVQDGEITTYAWCSVPEVMGILYYAVIIPEFGLISILCVFAYIRILYYLKKKAQQVAPEETVSRNVQNQQAATKMATLILGVYFATYLPKLIIIPFAKAGAPKWTDYATKVCQCILFINSWINPWLYAWKNKTFQGSFPEDTVVQENSPNYSCCSINW